MSHDGGGVAHVQRTFQRWPAQRLQVGARRGRVHAPLRPGQGGRQGVALLRVGAVAQHQVQVTAAQLHVVRGQGLLGGGTQHARAPRVRDPVRGAQVPGHVTGGRAAAVQQVGDAFVKGGARGSVHVVEHRGRRGRQPEDVTVEQPHGVESLDGLLDPGGRGVGQIAQGAGGGGCAEGGERPDHP